MPAPKGHKPYEGCETGGRPRRYSKEDIEKFADELKKWLKNPSNIWFKDFCLDRDIDPDLMTEWAEENKKFNGSYKIAKSRQESRLINGGLMNIYNASLVKFVLSNAHGWTDKQETKISGNSEDPFAVMMKEVNGTSKDLIKK